MEKHRRRIDRLMAHIRASKRVLAIYIERPTDYVRANVLGTVNLLEVMRMHGVKKLVFASSSSVYGNSPADLFSEDLKVTEPISPYAATKSAGEQICYTYSHLHGIRMVCLRLFTVYGPRQRPDLAIRKFVEKLEKGEPIEMYGDGTTESSLSPK